MSSLSLNPPDMEMATAPEAKSFLQTTTGFKVTKGTDTGYCFQGFECSRVRQCVQSSCARRPPLTVAPVLLQHDHHTQLQLLFIKTKHMLTVKLLVPCSAVGAKDTQPNQGRKNKPGGLFCRKPCCSNPFLPACMLALHTDLLSMPLIIWTGRHGQGVAVTVPATAYSTAQSAHNTDMLHHTRRSNSCVNRGGTTHIVALHTGQSTAPQVTSCRQVSKCLVTWK